MEFRKDYFSIRSDSTDYTNLEFTKNESFLNLSSILFVLHVPSCNRASTDVHGSPFRGFPKTIHRGVVADDFTTVRRDSRNENAIISGLRGRYAFFRSISFQKQSDPSLGRTYGKNSGRCFFPPSLSKNRRGLSVCITCGDTLRKNIIDYSSRFPYLEAART